MKVYVLTEISSGEVRIELDRQTIFKNLREAVDTLEKDYKRILKEIKGYGEITQSAFDLNYYSIILEADCEDTIYEGYVRELEIL